MTGGVGFTKDGITRIKNNINLLKKKAAFQRLKENLFRKKGINQLEIDPFTVNELYELKRERKNRERFKKRFFVLFRLVALALIILAFLLLNR